MLIFIYQTPLEDRTHGYLNPICKCKLEKQFCCHANVIKIESKIESKFILIKSKLNQNSFRFLEYF